MYIFFTANYNYVNDLLIISLKKPLASYEVNSLLFTRNSEELTFQLSVFAKENGLSESDLTFTVKTWLRIIPIRSSFIFYQQLSTYFSMLLLLLNCYCWFYLTYYFFYDNLIMTTFIWTVFKRSFHNTRPLYALRDARLFNNEQAQNQLRSATQGKYGQVILSSGNLQHKVTGLMVMQLTIKNVELRFFLTIWTLPVRNRGLNISCHLTNRLLCLHLRVN